MSSRGVFLTGFFAVLVQFGCGNKKEGCKLNEDCPSGMECVNGKCIEGSRDGTSDDGVVEEYMEDYEVWYDGGDPVVDRGAELETERLEQELVELDGFDVEDGGEAVGVIDSDGDTISDIDEGDGDVDTDGDTISDNFDTDSDNDTIPDSVEAGDSDPLSYPLDSDSDTIADFRDIDSDSDTILDEDEGGEDSDGDTIPNFRDLDSDSDMISDELEAGDSDLSTHPIDTDLDGTPDFLDDDSDNDTISDLDESVEDTDSDSIYDYVDTDSDGDGIPDSEEAGDDDISTPPVNCDGDSAYDFRDTDSDNDGVSDASELDYGTGICAPDSDDDGASDLVEIVYGSDPLDPLDNPRMRGDFIFTIPYLEPPDPTLDTLVFSTDLKEADIYFVIDTSSLMEGEIQNLATDLRDVIVPGIQSSIDDVQFGVGRFEDCPEQRNCTNSMRNLQNITDNIESVQAALDSITQFCGGREPYASVLWVIATGDTSPWASYAPGYFGPHPRNCPDPSFVGWPCFRVGALPIIIQIGNERFGQESTCLIHKSSSDAINALNAISAKYIGVNSGGTAVHSDMEVIARGTGSVDVGGSPLVFDIDPDGTGLGSQIVDAVTILLTQVPIEVGAVGRDDPFDGVDATQFIDRIIPNTIGGIPDPTDPARVCATGLMSADRDGDMVDDVFVDVLPGTDVCFDLHPAYNTIVSPSSEPLLFSAYIHVMGNEVTVLDTRQIYFLVPPEIPGSR